MSPMAESLVLLLEQSLEVTKRLYTKLVVESQPIEVWDADLQQREALIEHMKELIAEGGQFLHEHKVDFIEPMLHLDQQIKQAMGKEMAKLNEQQKIAKAKHQANSSYAGYNRVYEYGAFFDQKK